MPRSAKTKSQEHARAMHEHVALLAETCAAMRALLQMDVPEGEVGFVAKATIDHPAPRLVVDQDFGAVATSIGVVGAAAAPGTVARQVRERLVLQIGRGSAGAPIAVASLSKSKAADLAADLVNWASVLVGAGGFDDGAASDWDRRSLTALITAINELSHSLSAAGLVTAADAKLIGPLLRWRSA